MNLHAEMCKPIFGLKMQQKPFSGRYLLSPAVGACSMPPEHVAGVESCLAVAFTLTSSSAIAERPRCRVGRFWTKLEDDIL